MFGIDSPEMPPLDDDSGKRQQDDVDPSVPQGVVQEEPAMDVDPSVPQGIVAPAVTPPAAVAQLHPPGPGQYQGVHVYPTGGTIPPQQPGATSPTRAGQMQAYQNALLNQGNAAAIANLQGLYGAGWQNYWGGGTGATGSSGTVVPPIPPTPAPFVPRIPANPLGPGVSGPGGPPGVIPHAMPWLYNPRTGQTMTRPGQRRAPPTPAPSIPSIQRNPTAPGRHAKLYDQKTSGMTTKRRTKRIGTRNRM